MKTKAILAAIVVIVLGVGAWAMLGGGSSVKVELVPAWQVTPPSLYTADMQVEPFVSWAPDSRSLLFAGAGSKSYRNRIYMWKLGEKQVKPVVDGTSPNFIDSDTFIYLRTNLPHALMKYSLSSGKEEEIAQNIKTSEFWSEVNYLTYNPEHKSIILGLSKLSPYYNPGCQEFDLTGKLIGAYRLIKDDAVLDASWEPKGSRSVAVVGSETAPAQELRLGREGKEAEGAVVATGSIGAVAWSPNGRLIAYGDGVNVNVLNPETHKTVTVARFHAVPPNSTTCVRRLSWSPDSNSLAALDLVMDDTGGYPLIYVLDMSKLNL